VVWMMLALLGIAGLAVWDMNREAAAALDDFAHEQTTLAQSIAASLGPAADETSTDFAGLRAIEQPQIREVLLLPKNQADFHSTNGARVEAPFLLDAIVDGAASLRLTREQAGDLKLHKRMALAGFAPLDPAHPRAGTVVVVASAERERDRQRRAVWRLLSSVGVAGFLVFAFGGMALRRQRERLELEHTLAIATLQEERDKKLALLDKAATMGALATGIAHEVSTPLGVIVGRAEQLQAKASEEKEKKAVAVILEQAERISRIVRGLLGLARGDSPHLERVAAASLAVKAQELVRHRFEKGQVSLDVDIAGGLPSVACEPRLFEQAIVNLLLNACDACPPGGHVRFSVAKGDDGKIAFTVVDDGEGISKEAAERATEAFFTTKAGASGTGLGLAIASEIVKHHNGSIAIAPRPASEGHGTVARIAVPAFEEKTSDG
ncbi:MAG TPA: HAMP domain-containing sensor histidine kinase, partial [Polyangiaceae bacterium]